MSKDQVISELENAIFLALELNGGGQFEEAWNVLTLAKWGTLERRISKKILKKRMLGIGEEIVVGREYVTRKGGRFKIIARVDPRVFALVAGIWVEWNIMGMRGIGGDSSEDLIAELMPSLGDVGWI